MDDTALRQLLDELPNTPADKQPEKILTAIGNADDLVDILDSGCLTGAEIKHFLTTLPAPERAFLAQYVEDGEREDWRQLLRQA